MPRGERQRRWLIAATAAVASLAVAAPAGAVYPPIFPPSAPQAVLATPGDARAVITWQPPASPGDSAINGYRVTSIPASAGCTVGPAALTCEISGLTNGTSYIFSVAASNAAGFGSAGVSNPVTPTSNKPEIAASGVRSATTASVTGTTKNVPAGASLASSVRIEGNSSFAPGPSVTVDANGTFAWTTSVPADKGVDVFFSYQGVDSNIVSLPADAQISLAIGGSRTDEAISISGLATNVAAGASVSILARILPASGFVPVGTATVDAGGRFTWTGDYPPDQGVQVVAEISGVRSNLLAFPGGVSVAIVIAGSRTLDGRKVAVEGSTVGITPGFAVEPALLLDGEPAVASPATVGAGGSFTWGRRVGAGRSVTISFAFGDAVSNTVVLAPGARSIGISGAREGSTISVTGVTSGIDEGTPVVPYVRADGDGGFQRGMPVRVGADGDFTWSQVLAPTRGALVYFAGAGTTSNTVAIPASASTLVIAGARTGTSIAITGIAANAEPGTPVTLRTRAFTQRAFATAGETTVGADGSFAFTVSAERAVGLAAFAQIDRARSNTVTFDPLDPVIVLLGARFTSARSLVANGQAFNVPVGTVLVPFISLDGGPVETGVGARTLNENGDFLWRRDVVPGRSSAVLYFATADGVTSNSLTIRRP